MADATELPFPDDVFDAVSQFTALCNIRDTARTSGCHLAASRTRLFPGFSLSARRRGFHRWSEMLAGRAPELALAIERLPVSKSHLAGVLRRDRASVEG
jgi:hypothetical protein